MTQKLVSDRSGASTCGHEPTCSEIGRVACRSIQQPIDLLTTPWQKQERMCLRLQGAILEYLRFLNPLFRVLHLHVYAGRYFFIGRGTPLTKCLKWVSEDIKIR